MTRMGVRLEEVTPGALVGGIFGDGSVTVVAVRWIGSNALAAHLPHPGRAPG